MFTIVYFMKNNEIFIFTPYITLGNLLKLTGKISFGGEAKFFLLENKVLVNNIIENRRGRKIYPNDIVNIDKDYFFIKIRGE